MRTPLVLVTAVLLLALACKNLDPGSAAQLASRLANQECRRLYRQQPFKPSTYEAKFDSSRWYWGRLDIVGIDGLSAEVSFLADGSDQQVKVYLTADHRDEEDFNKMKEQLQLKPREKGIPKQDLPPDIIRE